MCQHLAHFNEIGIGSWGDPFFQRGRKMVLGEDYHSRFQGFAPLWYDTTSDHNGNTQSHIQLE